VGIAIKSNDYFFIFLNKNRLNNKNKKWFL